MLPKYNEKYKTESGYLHNLLCKENIYRPSTKKKFKKRKPILNRKALNMYKFKFNVVFHYFRIHVKLEKKNCLYFLPKQNISNVSLVCFLYFRNLNLPLILGFLEENALKILYKKRKSISNV